MCHNTVELTLFLMAFSYLLFLRFYSTKNTCAIIYIKTLLKYAFKYFLKNFDYITIFKLQLF